MICENTRIMKSVVGLIKKHYIRGYSLIVSNRVTILIQKASDWMNLSSGI